MRTMLLSLRPDVFDNVASGNKIYEHRKVFPDELIKAYIYISRPVQAIAGVMYLDNKISLDEWKNKYSYDLDAINRIDEYKTRNNFAMEIKKFQNTNKIPLAELREKFHKFLIPQMYYFLDGSELLEYLETNLLPNGDVVEHSFENITSDMICRY